MIDTPQIIRTEPQLTAVIHLTIPKDKIRDVMQPGLTELMSTLATQGIKPTGAWFDHHFKMVEDSWDFEICVPVSVPVKAVGRVRPSKWPAMKVARTVFRGDYEGLYEAWDEFLAWIHKSGNTPAQDQYQCFTVGPESTPDPAQWRTELYKPLK